MSEGTGLTQRKPSNAIDNSSSAKQRSENVAAAENLMKTVDELAPKSVKPYITAAIPYIMSIVACVDVMIPVLYTLYERAIFYKDILEPYKLNLLLPGFLGLIMCFFGGSFMTIIAAVEAYRMVGLQSQAKFFMDLKVDFAAFMAANKDDDVIDDDNDGIPDVQQIDKKSLVQRKTLLFLKTVDPSRVGDALSGLQSGLLAVVATLKLQFCKAITLGSAIGDILMNPCNKFLVPALEVALPEEYKKWAGPVISYSVKSFAVSVAWFLQRLISAFHSALRGGHMCATNILEYMDKMGYVSINPDETYIDEIAGYCLAGIGLWFQLSMGFTLPFPLNLLLLPFTILEWWLMWLVNSS